MKIRTPSEHVLCETPKSFRAENRSGIASDLVGAETVRLSVVFGNEQYPSGSTIYVVGNTVGTAPTVSLDGRQLKKVLSQQVLAFEAGDACCEDDRCIHTRVVDDVRPRRFE